MKTKGFIIFVYLIFSLKVFCQNDSLNTISHSPLTITLENLDKGKVFQSKNYLRRLRIKITNKTDTAFSFWVMSCSWDGCIRFTPNVAYRYYVGCDKNASEKITLKPNENHLLEADFKFFDRVLKKSTLISIGFRVITKLPKYDFENPNNKESPFSIFRDSPKYTYKDFIWSNPIAIKF
jgi:hypothetical protein